ncbi:hypothetical protein E2542_SST17614 [Spatholobus suberectus]|nr:hypothetical protein E2542_SST17614 [Spatholobus suberectus]
MAIVSIAESDKCPVASPEPSFSTKTHFAFCTDSKGIKSIKLYKRGTRKICNTDSIRQRTQTPFWFRGTSYNDCY